ncbi:hypothetical protein GOP47_0007070 [Adiantum capillus-veneris]|uniref:Serine aminopeptidase S33 domain-containing protein n=1 Tax=Adiantum capillus-veneris TaxID=13818 RepID=A0A9D4ZL61_ADICA|nr:hypothetical protein GOP47_0007070 [Adiantum capillus-veneris]
MLKLLQELAETNNAALTSQQQEIFDPEIAGPCRAFEASHDASSCPKTRASYVSRVKMSTSPHDPAGLVSQAAQKRVTISNPMGESLVGVFDNSGSLDTVVLCHGFRSSKESSTLTSITSQLVATGYSSFRFDFSGNGESDGEFHYGNYWKEVEDLRSVICYLAAQGHKVKAIVGHSKGGDVVLLYASKYGDISTVVNLSGRFNLHAGVKERLGERGLQLIEEQGFLEIKDKEGNIEYTVTNEDLRERLSTDMKAAVIAIPENLRILTVHGTEDKIVTVEDAKEFDRFIPNHKLHILDGANHGFTQHREDLQQLVVEFIREDM